MMSTFCTASGERLTTHLLDWTHCWSIVSWRSETSPLKE